MKTRLILADDHPMVLQGISDIIARTDDLTIIATISDGRGVEDVVTRSPAELLLLDIGLPGKNGLEVLRSLRAAGVDIPVLFFTMYPADQYARHARKSGAQGFLSKDAGADELLASIRRVIDGGTVYPRRSPGQGNGEPMNNVPTDARLSAREQDILKGLLQGTPLVAIADALAISPKSVSTYRRRILDKMHVSNNAELLALLRRQGASL